MKPEAQWYLVETLANARAGLGMRSDYESRFGNLSHFAGVLAGYRYLGVITQDEENAWSRKMLIALGYAPPEPAPPGEARAMYIGDPKDLHPEVEIVETIPRFVRSVAGPDEEFELYGGKLRVVAVEIYDNSAVVRWRVSPEPDISAVFPDEAMALETDIEGLEDWAAEELRNKAQRRMRMTRLYHFDLADDVDTTYHRDGSSHGGGNSGMTGEAKFQPGPPSTASFLTFTWLTLNVEIRLA